MVFEIEMKALLTEEQYSKLSQELNERLQLINEDTIHTTRFSPGDLRLRHSNKIREVICKDGDATSVSRKEVSVKLPEQEDLEKFKQLFEILGFKPYPSWINHKQEFEYEFNGYKYVLCLQHIENFAHILEVEYVSENDDKHLHEPNQRAIMKELGCEPINNEEFSEKIKKYIQKNKEELK